MTRLRILWVVSPGVLRVTTNVVTTAHMPRLASASLTGLINTSNSVRKTP
eukprot:CAMPEP_0178809554 /NCGR_PEP_ID=MMETSP0745-20121128/18172_1 /TAXON_ID=913974 /ORGANISM="Nitzschia punctata, Strain CCMP561" /LENGTH=49 /DNA_ID= /DNA_START= /DNA_END= /DNA_ORIENTATION=